jgi:hypothetical protein
MPPTLDCPGLGRDVAAPLPLELLLLKVGGTNGADEAAVVVGVGITGGTTVVSTVATTGVVVGITGASAYVVTRAVVSASYNSLAPSTLLASLFY